MAASMKATLATLFTMLIVGLLLRTSGLFENFGTAPFNIAAIFLGLLGAFVWIVVYKKGRCQ